MLFRRSAKEVKSPTEYLKEYVDVLEDTCVISETEISNVSMTVCKKWQDKNNCTLVAVCNVLEHYAGMYDFIPSDMDERYKVVHEQAVACGYDGIHGVSVFKNRKLVNRVIHAFCKKGFFKAKSRYFPSKKRVIKVLDAGQPLLLSIGSGYYFDHTVTVYGYVTCTDRTTGKSYVLLKVADGWHDTCRYIPWTHTGAHHITCMTLLVNL